MNFVLQVIYRIDDSNLPLFVAQQMDLFIDGSETKVAERKAAVASAAFERAGTFSF